MKNKKIIQYSLMFLLGLMTLMSCNSDDSSNELEKDQAYIKLNRAKMQLWSIVLEDDKYFSYNNVRPIDPKVEENLGNLGKDVTFTFLLEYKMNGKVVSEEKEYIIPFGMISDPESVSNMDFDSGVFVEYEENSFSIGELGSAIESIQPNNFDYFFPVDIAYDTELNQYPDVSVRIFGESDCLSAYNVDEKTFSNYTISGDTKEYRSASAEGNIYNLSVIYDHNNSYSYSICD